MPKSATTHLGYARNLGQFFSPDILVKKCLSLVQNRGGRLLEPSCGAGAFDAARSDNSVFIEIDQKVINDQPVLVMDFFDYPVSEQFDTIIGNPPYVDNALFTAPKSSQIKVQANLYLYFIEKCFHHLRPHGELIFIAPREFIKLTSARFVNNLLCKHGTITHFFDFGDEKLFAEACPNVCIFRYEKDNFSHQTETFDGIFQLKNHDGLISFVSDDSDATLGDFFEVKVGAVSGADQYFEHPDGVEFVCSKTRGSSLLRKMLYDSNHPSLEPYHDILIKRKIKRFTEENWFAWGRTVDFRLGSPRIYVNCKTRQSNPFFLNSCERWDGSVLALFPKKPIDLQSAADILNALDWNKLGFMTGGRYLFTQKSLTETPINGTIFEQNR